mmetsp:Transcript_22985/g.36002  ORF Transcript_22985/g.36002 Transcript_22985/m.36002 type:complete len:130 (-) Transcript_22985:17-406(-)
MYPGSYGGYPGSFASYGSIGNMSATGGMLGMMPRMTSMPMMGPAIPPTMGGMSMIGPGMPPNSGMFPYASNMDLGVVSGYAASIQEAQVVGSSQPVMGRSPGGYPLVQNDFQYTDLGYGPRGFQRKFPW